jgi:tRNA(Ile2)-agmatinylcytidine synthase
MIYLLGIDDTDTRFGHSTTHLGYLVLRELARIGCTFSTYPRLVRLNPNIPFKTRGNAAVPRRLNKT